MRRPPWWRSDFRFEVTDAVSPGRWHGLLRVDVDDGRYDVELTVTTWDEQF